MEYTIIPNHNPNIYLLDVCCTEEAGEILLHHTLHPVIATRLKDGIVMDHICFGHDEPLREYGLTGSGNQVNGLAIYDRSIDCVHNKGDGNTFTLEEQFQRCRKWIEEITPL